jgi:5-methylcytosine-specific restriction endonuclease McrA
MRGRSALGSNGSTRRWRDIRQRIVKRDRRMCQVCGMVTLRGDVDHIMPRIAGGSDDPSNLRYLCKAHHKARREPVFLDERNGHAAAVRNLHTPGLPVVRETLTKGAA